MYNGQQHTSTPKRRRLGTKRVLPSSQFTSSKRNDIDLKRAKSSKDIIEPARCESPLLPCNQIEYLHDSACNNNSSPSEIPCSPILLDNTIIRDAKNWESLELINDKKHIIEKYKHQAINKSIDITDISKNMFCSKLDVEPDHVDTILTSRCEKYFRENVEESFNNVNLSIIQSHTDKIQKDLNKSSLFDTKDSFLLDIKESCIVANEPKHKPNNQNVNKLQSNVINNNYFYGLPLITKGLFKSYRSIEKLYDWQEECLNLTAIKERKNLIYALPTSGGKTLVAEVLMLREVLNRKRNALFILPFVAIVQEKIWSLSPFAVQLDFLVEEYAAGKGHIPPKKRRKKNSIYIATIEKGLALIRSLIELNRLNEIGLIVVDELHLIGEPGRGGTLETLLTTVLFANQGIQIVGMSATIGNLPELAHFLHAEVYQRDFRPVELTEFVKLGNMLHKIHRGKDGVEVVPDRELVYDYTAAATALDPDLLGGLVSEVVPQHSCLVFCPTKRNCENVAALLCKLQRREMACHRTEERASLEGALRGEGAEPTLARCVRYGVAYHHAGLAGDERALLEHAFRSGVISVICCTSTLAAGVNLPARRVVLRAPYVGRELVSLAAYRQMAGRAGRAGVCTAGESIVICQPRDWELLRGVLCGALAPARSVLARSGSVAGLVLSGVALRLATTRASLRSLLDTTLMAVSPPSQDGTPIDIKEICDTTLRALLQSEVLEVVSKKKPNTNEKVDRKTTAQDPEESHTLGKDGDCYVYNDTQLAVSKMGRAAIKGCMDQNTANQLLQDLETASKSLVVMGSLHLLYLVTPHDGAGVRPDYRHYYSLYSKLDEEGTQTAMILGITEMNAIRMMTGKPITNVPELVLHRFYLALMLHDLWKQVPFAAVADKYSVPRGKVQSVMSSAVAFSSNAHKFCEELEHLWTFSALFGELSIRLQHCAAPELQHLMELPAVKKTRALQLVRAGYKRVEDLAKATVDNLVSSVVHLSRTAANHLISAARMMLIEKVENLRAEAEDVMEELNA